MRDTGVETKTVNGEEKHQARLMTLLRGLVREKQLKGAAETLGVDPRTVQTSLERDELSVLLRTSLERWLAADARGDVARLRERTDALEEGMATLKKEIQRGLDGVSGKIGNLMEGQVQGLESLERRLARVEALGDHPAQVDDPSGAERQREEAPAAAKPLAKARFPKRLYPELVTKEPAPDDDEVYGEAWPLIEEWREIWNTGHVGTGKGLAWLETEERVRELEVAMLEEHGLTLPPEKQPLHGLWRSTQLNWRRETLNEVRRAVAWRRLVRKVLTFGLWRSRWWWRA